MNISHIEFMNSVKSLPAIIQDMLKLPSDLVGDLRLDNYKLNSVSSIGTAPDSLHMTLIFGVSLCGGDSLVNGFSVTLYDCFNFGHAWCWKINKAHAKVHLPGQLAIVAPDWRVPLLLPLIGQIVSVKIKPDLHKFCTILNDCKSAPD